MKPRKIAQQLNKMHFMPIEIKPECALISILSESDFMFYHHASVSKSDDCMYKQYILWSFTTEEQTDMGFAVCVVINIKHFSLGSNHIQRLK